MPITYARQRVRRTVGSRTVGEYVERHGLKPVAVYIPLEWHQALASIAVECDTPMQALFTLACSKYYGKRHKLPPLLPPTRTKQDPHKNFTWYADIDLHKQIKLLAIDIDGTAQQLILSAVMDYLKHAPRVKALRLPTGPQSYGRAPLEPVNSPAGQAGQAGRRQRAAA